MNRTIFPLKSPMRTLAVADLQDALQLLLDRGDIQGSNDVALPELAGKLKAERSSGEFGEATATLVAAFQKQHGLPVGNGVDEATASKLNEALGLEPPPTGRLDAGIEADLLAFLRSETSPKVLAEELLKYLISHVAAGTKEGGKSPQSTHAEDVVLWLAQSEAPVIADQLISVLRDIPGTDADRLQRLGIAQRLKKLPSGLLDKARTRKAATRLPVVNVPAATTLPVAPSGPAKRELEVLQEVSARLMIPPELGRVLLARTSVPPVKPAPASPADSEAHRADAAIASVARLGWSQVEKRIDDQAHQQPGSKPLDEPARKHLRLRLGQALLKGSRHHVGAATVDELLEAAGMPAPQREQVASAAAACPEWLWRKGPDELKDDGQLDAAVHAKLSQIVAFADLVGHDAQVVKALAEAGGSDGLPDIGTVMGWTADQWRSTLGDSRTASRMPADRQYRHVVARSRVTRQAAWQRSGTFPGLGRGPDRQILASAMEQAALARSTGDTTGRADLLTSTEVLSRLQGDDLKQRAHALAGLSGLALDDREIGALMDKAPTGLRGIRAGGLQWLKATLGGRANDTDHQERMATVFDDAAFIADAGLVLAMNGETSVGPVRANTKPDWAGLFGPQELEPCDERESALGEVAYLEDLVAFISQDSADSPMFKALAARRPDVKAYDKPVNRSTDDVPEIDIVNELLGWWSLPASAQHWPADPVAWGVSPSAKDPTVNPAMAYPEVDQALKEAPQPWNEAARRVVLYLAALGVREADLQRWVSEHTAAKGAAPAGPAVSATNRTLPTKTTKLEALVEQLKPKSAQAASAPSAIDVSFLKKCLEQPEIEQANTLLALIAQAEGEAWPEVVRPLHDLLRQEREGKLIALLGGDPHALMDKLLIDVSVGAGRRTSRAAAVAAAVRLFVDRVALGGESPLTLDADQQAHWKWLRSFDQWRLHRRIFLQPASLLRPELRDDKTPLFKELEQELGQNKIEPKGVDRAVRNYLVKLKAIASLQVCATCSSTFGLDRQGEVVHVIARTHEAPHTYYHRTRVNGARWTPWEQIHTDIDGDQLIPVVFDGRLFVFWPVIEEQIDPQFRKLEELLATLFRGQANMTIATAAGALGMAQAIKDEVGSVVEGIRRLLETASAPWERAASESSSFGGRVGDFFKDVNEQVSGRIDAAPKLPRPAPPLAPAEIEPFGDLQASIHAIEAAFVTPTEDELAGVLQSLKDNDIGAAFGKFVGVLQQLFKDIQACLPTKRIAIKLAWAERQDDAWTDRKISNQSISYGDLSALFPGRRKRLYDFAAHVDGERHLQVECGLASPPTSLGSFRLDRAGDVLHANSADTTIELKAEDIESGLQDAIANVAHRFTEGRPVSKADQIDSPIRATLAGTLKDADAWRLVTPPPASLSDDDPSDLPSTFFLERDGRTLIFDWQVVGAHFRGELGSPTWRRWLPVIRPFDHPAAGELLQQVSGEIVLGLYDRISVAEDSWIADQLKRPEDNRAPLAHQVEFDYSGAYAQYNWELFYHLPLYVAAEYNRARQFEAAQTWLRVIFNPAEPAGGDTTVAEGQRFWQMPGLRTDAGSSQGLRQQLEAVANEAADAELPSAVLEQVRVWRADPFNPWAIARLRPKALQQAVVMAYVKNLVDWADDLAKKRGREFVQETTRLYAEALFLTGPQPSNAPRSPAVGVRAALQVSAQARQRLLQLESRIASAARPQLSPRLLAGDAAAYRRNDWQLGRSLTLADVVGADSEFRIPRDPWLDAQWADIEQKLERLRQRTPASDSAIDALLPGVTLGSPPNASQLPILQTLPPYRFAVVVQKARDFADWLSGLASAQLSAIEKFNGEQLAVLRSNQEAELKRETLSIKRWQFDEAVRSRQQIELSRASVAARALHHIKNVALPLNPFETVSLAAKLASTGLGAAQATLSLAAAAVSIAPHVKLAFITSLGMQIGHDQVKDVAENMARAVGGVAGVLASSAEVLGTMGAYERRWEESILSLALLAVEEVQLEKQIEASKLRERVAKRELDNFEMQIRHSQQIDEFLHEKFSNEDLYKWMADKLNLHYREAFESARSLVAQAEACKRYELGQFGQIDNTLLLGELAVESLDDHLGLLAGQSMSHRLRRMEAEYLRENKRDFELTKNVSLVLHDPAEFIRLKHTGHCEIRLPEALFDADYPGHYMRRIRTVSVMVPCIMGPYANLNCTLRLNNSWVRHSSLPPPAGAGYYDITPAHVVPLSPRSQVPVAAIATSNAQGDSGMFESNLRDDRYLPFEGAGAISEWDVEMLPESNAIDFDTISDFVLRVSYTARHSNDLRDAARIALLQPATSAPTGEPPVQQPLRRMFSVRHEFVDAWHRYVRGQGSSRQLELAFTPEHFVRRPGRPPNKIVSITVLHVARGQGDELMFNRPVTLDVTLASGGPSPQMSPETLAPSEINVWKATWPQGIPLRSAVQLSDDGPLPADIWLLCELE